MTSSNEQRFATVDLLIWLTSSEQAKQISVVSQAEEFTIRNITYKPGKRIKLGTPAGFQALTGISRESQKGLIENQPGMYKEKLDSRGNPLPTSLEVVHWVNWAALLQILDRQGTPARNPHNSDAIVYHDSRTVDGDLYPAWRQLRDAYENGLMAPIERYYSAVIASVLTPQRGVTPLTAQKRKSANTEVSAIPTEDLRMQELARSGFTPEQIEAMTAALNSLQPIPTLTRLVRQYMKDQRFQSSEDLAIQLLGARRNPKSHAAFAPMVRLIDQILNEESSIDDENSAYYLTMSQLALVLSDGDTTFDGNVKKLLAHCRTSSSKSSSR